MFDVFQCGVGTKPLPKRPANRQPAESHGQAGSEELRNTRGHTRLSRSGANIMGVGRTGQLVLLESDYGMHQGLS